MGGDKTVQIILDGFPAGGKEMPYQGSKAGRIGLGIHIGTQIEPDPLRVHMRGRIKGRALQYHEGTDGIHRSAKHGKGGIIL
jgi:hypothetical protein